jgi:hypothetical protein
MKFPKLLLPLLLALICVGGARAEESLEATFTHPPTRAGAYVWWHWMGSNISKEGIGGDEGVRYRRGHDF